MTVNEKYVEEVTSRAIRAVKRQTAVDVKHIIEEAFIHVYRQGYEAGKGKDETN